MNRRPVTAGLLGGTLEDPELLGSRCRACDAVTFPAQGSCPRCAAENMAVTGLPHRGTLWTWTVQRFAPKSPPYGRAVTEATFEPYALGYVDLGEVRVEARLAVDGAEDLRIGMELELCLVPLWAGEDGAEVVAPAFRPVAPAER